MRGHVGNKFIDQIDVACVDQLVYDEFHRITVETLHKQVRPVISVVFYLEEETFLQIVFRNDGEIKMHILEIAQYLTEVVYKVKG